MRLTLRQLSANCNEVRIGDLSLYFSYETCVGFYHGSTGTVLSENVWSSTTGKHLNNFGDKSRRIPNAEFETKLNEITKSVLGGK